MKDKKRYDERKKNRQRKEVVYIKTEEKKKEVNEK